MVSWGFILDLLKHPHPSKSHPSRVCAQWPQVPIQFRLGPLTTLSIGFGTLPRGGRGITYRPSTLPDKPLEIWAYEASPFCKLAREVPCSCAMRPHGCVPFLQQHSLRASTSCMNCGVA